MSFHVGQQVECIIDGVHPVHGTTARELVKGKIYTVTEVGVWFTYPWCRVDSVPVLVGFYQSRFRPVTKTSIDVFEKFLQPVKDLVDA